MGGYCRWWRGKGGCIAMQPGHGGHRPNASVHNSPRAAEYAPLSMPTQFRRTLAHPRFTLAVLAAVFMTVAVSTWSYDPLATAWAALALLGGIACAYATWRPSRLAVTFAGTASITISITRALALFWTITTDDWDGDRNVASLAVGVGTWTGLALLLWVTWVHVFLPWAAIMRGRLHGGR